MTTRSIVVYTLDFVEDLQQPISPSTQRNPLYLYNIGRRTPVAQKQAIPDVAFRGVSFSKVRVVSGAETRRVSASLLTYDVLRGLFHFEVTLTLPHAAVRRAPAAPTPLDLSCTLLAAHRMAQLVPLEEIVQSGTPAPRSGFTPGSRGFISACALGAQGKRGVWIERQRSNMGRTVFGFAAADHRPPCVPREAGSASDGAAEERSVAEIDGRCIYAVRSSVDLRGKS
ncbi:uncharacterized protein PHACADRAFT_263873 [Phanerochaete carnosa HHB-10118-sp]|uniref:Uncharacterized protein n=1 Tax=Phanerochaete carnosa (strain HHB-10118-sp) TaxID=650164 RepID=K5WJV3_PHACS|nr:uncharacterized protein PHACADRAFT_263873 [Phanerochaete carnosa HHB-10118-sp]EKM50537.1 hypothetical protein PHACADRAFT_263873 [Phanerochaete carnosa HHB-10118-sp]